MIKYEIDHGGDFQLCLNIGYNVQGSLYVVENINIR